jgi:hypothetical protein
MAHSTIAAIAWTLGSPTSQGSPSGVHPVGMGETYMRRLSDLLGSADHNSRNTSQEVQNLALIPNAGDSILIRHSGEMVVAGGEPHASAMTGMAWLGYRLHGRSRLEVRIKEE